MQAATDGASLCSVSRTGEQIPGVKYLEGRWAALRELHRALRRGADPAQVVAAIRNDWQFDLDQRRNAGQRNWEVYRLGGVDALDEIADLLDR